MELQAFLKEENHLPKDRFIPISVCFQKDGEPALWQLRAISENAFRKKAGQDRWAALCLVSVVYPCLEDQALWESYGADSAETVLKEMLRPGEYLKLLEEVKALNSFDLRRRDWKSEVKNA